MGRNLAQSPAKLLSYMYFAAKMQQPHLAHAHMHHKNATSAIQGLKELTIQDHQNP